MRRTIRGCRTIVTGTSSGIGRALALELASRNAKLVLNARRADRLSVLADEIKSRGGEALIVAGDVTDPQTRERLVSAPLESWGGLDLLINNAGIGAHGPFAQASPERLRRIMEVNYFAPLELIRLALPKLIEGNHPMVVNISSVLGHRAMPGKSEYCASKFALHGFSDSLRAELVESRVDVLIVSPSTTESEFFDNVLEGGGETRSNRLPMSAATVARKTARAIELGKHEIILSARGKLLVWVDRLFPSLADRLVAQYGSMSRRRSKGSRGT
jgi:short-subunit dehydrogenase